MRVKATRTGLLDSPNGPSRVREGVVFEVKPEEINDVWMFPVDEEAKEYFRSKKTSAKKSGVDAMRENAALKAELAALKSKKSKGKDSVI